jgi:hypothetical protein
MLSPMSAEILANHIIHERMTQAAHAALVAQLPTLSPSRRPAAGARRRVASGLRALAYRLDPCARSEPALATAIPG